MPIEAWRMKRLLQTARCVGALLGSADASRRSTSSPPPRTWRRSRGRSAATRSTVESLAQGLPGPALRRGQAELHPQAPHGRPAGRRSAASWRSAGCRRSSPRAATRRSSPGGAGYLDASLTARILDIPTGQITRAMGDVHPSGNPHYWLDPENGRRIAQAIAGEAGAAEPRRRRLLRRSATRTSTGASPRRRSAGRRRWRRTRD